MLPWLQPEIKGMMRFCDNGCKGENIKHTNDKVNVKYKNRFEVGLKYKKIFSLEKMSLSS